MSYLLVGAAGMVGALLRYYVGIIFNAGGTGSFPLGTFIANMVGSFVLGWFTIHIIAMKRIHPNVLTAIGTGLIGSFTTFSTFSVETVQLLREGHWAMGIFYILISLLGGLFMSAFGYFIGKHFYRKWKERES